MGVVLGVCLVVICVVNIVCCCGFVVCSLCCNVCFLCKNFILMRIVYFIFLFFGLILLCIVFILGIREEMDKILKFCEVRLVKCFIILKYLKVSNLFFEYFVKCDIY